MKASAIDPPTSSITRLRPVSAHTEPQIITTVQASARRPTTIRTPPIAPPSAPSPGIASSGAARAPVAKAPPMISDEGGEDAEGPEDEAEDGGDDHVRRAAPVPPDLP